MHARPCRRKHKCKCTFASLSNCGQDIDIDMIVSQFSWLGYATTADPFQHKCTKTLKLLKPNGKCIKIRKDTSVFSNIASKINS